MAYIEGKTAHRYLGRDKACVEVVVTKVYPDGRCMLEDGSVINRFTRFSYHEAEACPILNFKLVDTTKVTVKFPEVVEMRRYPSKSKPNKEPYVTQKLSNGSYTCNCPWRTYHPIDLCTHIKEWMKENGLPVPD